MLPPTAVLLATSPRCPVQMFRVKQNLYATQFHPELDVRGHRHPGARLPARRLLPARGARRAHRPAEPRGGDRAGPDPRQLRRPLRLTPTEAAGHGQEAGYRARPHRRRSGRTSPSRPSRVAAGSPRKLSQVSAAMRTRNETGATASTAPRGRPRSSSANRIRQDTATIPAMTPSHRGGRPRNGSSVAANSVTPTNSRSSPRGSHWLSVPAAAGCAGSATTASSRVISAGARVATAGRALPRLRLG